MGSHTFYRWKVKYGGMEVSQARRLRELEDENRRTKHIVADQALDIRALKSAESGEACGMTRRRSLSAADPQDERTAELQTDTRVWRATHRYRSKRKDAGVLRRRRREPAAEYPRYGYWRLYRKLRREGAIVNHKRVYRLYREDGLSARKRSRKRLGRARVPASVPVAPNVRGSMDFVSDSLPDGRKLGVFNVVDDYSRDALIMAVDTLVGGQRVARLLDEQAAIRGAYPQSIVCDNGPEFISHALDRWARSTASSWSPFSR